MADASLTKMRDDLAKEKAELVAALQKLAEAEAQYRANLQRTDGALFVVQKLIDEQDAKPADPPKGKRKRG